MPVKIRTTLAIPVTNCLINMQFNSCMHLHLGSVFRNYFFLIYDVNFMIPKFPNYYKDFSDKLIQCNPDIRDPDIRETRI